mgnify:CR=1 FL=1
MDAMQSRHMQTLSTRNLVIDIPGRADGYPLDLTIGSGQIWGVLGPNGAGKTTLLHTLAGLRPPRAGALYLDDVSVSGIKRRVFSQQLGLVFQDRQDGFPATVMETALIGRHPWLSPWQMEGAGDLAMAQRALEALDVLHLKDRLVSTLSGGERQRVAIATLMTQSPHTWLLDEPTNHLDLDAVLWLERYITDQLPASSTLLTVSHDRGFLDETSTDLINLSDDGGLESHRGGLAKLDAGAKARLAKRTKDYALQQKTLKEERSKHPSLRAEKLEQRVLEKLGAPRLVEKPREYAVHFDLRAPDDARAAMQAGGQLREGRARVAQQDARRGERP